MQRLYKFLVVLMMLLCGKTLFSQRATLTVAPPAVIFSQHNLPASATSKGSMALFTVVSLRSPFYLTLPAQAVIEPDYYTRHMGYFCKKELLLEKATAIPFRFRLGTLDYVNRMEGK